MSPKKVMVVDDEADIRELLSRALTKAGYQVKTAASAEEALVILEKDKYWVFFLDLKLPGMNGIELCKRIREENPMVIAYAVTGHAGLFEVFECRGAGFEDYYTKPVELKTVLAAAEQAFEKLGRWKKG
jgi:CheY-like chemotaxis protein